MLPIIAIFARNDKAEAAYGAPSIFRKATIKKFLEERVAQLPGGPGPEPGLKDWDAWYEASTNYYEARFVKRSIENRNPVGAREQIAKPRASR